jgi:hypothetical protein
MRFEELYARRNRGDLTMVETAEILGITQLFLQLNVRYEAEGVVGLLE